MEKNDYHTVFIEWKSYAEHFCKKGQFDLT